MDFDRGMQIFSGDTNWCSNTMEAYDKKHRNTSGSGKREYVEYRGDDFKAHYDSIIDGISMGIIY